MLKQILISTVLYAVMVTSAAGMGKWQKVSVSLIKDNLKVTSSGTEPGTAGGKEKEEKIRVVITFDQDALEKNSPEELLQRVSDQIDAETALKIHRKLADNRITVDMPAGAVETAKLTKGVESVIPVEKADLTSGNGETRTGANKGAQEAEASSETKETGAKESTKETTETTENTENSKAAESGPKEPDKSSEGKEPEDGNGTVQSSGLAAGLLTAAAGVAVIGAGAGYVVKRKRQKERDGK